MPRILIPLAERLWRRVAVGEPDECWEWQGKSRTSKGGNGGYALIARGGADRRLIRTHRVAFESTYGPVPKGLFVLHSCDNPPCCNPEHLSIGDHYDNFVDVSVRDRLRKGEDRADSKLTGFDVRYIRTMYAAGVATQTELANEHALDRSTISYIINRKRWKHIAPIQGAS